MRTRRQVLGQNFLHHRPTIQKIITAAEATLILAPRSILEVGPGKCAITKDLEKLATANEIPLLLVERDQFLEEDLRTNITTAELSFMDAATPKFLNLLDQAYEAGRSPILFVSNLPYSASSQILANLCARRRYLSSAIVMVQKELAQRMMAPAKSSERGSFSLLIQSYFSVKKLFDVGPGAFNPPPKVMSSVLQLDPLATSPIDAVGEPKEFERFCKQLFSQRRKMIRKSVSPEKQKLFPKLGISGTERPEELELQVIIDLFVGNT